MCAYGIEHEKKYNKSDVTSLTVSTESVLTTSTIDASENWDVKIFDVPDELLTVNMDKEVILFLGLDITKIMVTISIITYRY